MSTLISATNQHALQTIQNTEYGPTTATATAAAADDPPDLFAAGLTPDALMTYCQSRLESIDSQVQASFDSQQKGAADIARINKVTDDLKNLSAAGATSSEACTNIENSLGSAISDLQHSDPASLALPGLIQTYNNMVWSGTGGSTTDPAKGSTGPQFIEPDKYPPDKSLSPQGDNDLAPSEIESYIQGVGDATAAVNSNSELQMIQLQSLMSQRQTAISLTTNLVQSLGDQENKIAENIGH